MVPITILGGSGATLMSFVRVARFTASLAVTAGAVVALPFAASTGCGSSGNAGGSDAAFIPPFNAGDSGQTGSTSSGGTAGTGPGTSGVNTTGTGPGGGSSGGSGSISSGGACTTNTGAITGTVTTTGGSVSRLVFGVVGDTRPTNEDDPSGYPTAIITKIFQDIEAQSPHPVLALGTGDYQFTEASNDTDATAQISLFMQARTGYSGPWFPAMGNHECGVSGSYTTSDNNDCGPGNPGGATANYNAFISGMMTPINQTLPYYSIKVSASDSSWTAKFVVTAANAWSSAQQTWLTTTMAEPTTYTFVVRHEASDATPPIPDCIPVIDSIITAAGYTLLIVGHTHNYGHYTDAPQTVVLGNGGAPLSSGDYGYGLFSQRCDGAIVVDEYDYLSGATDSYFHFVITPTGTITQ
jgi:hypothetical protein